jgi:membrane fusion protein (multidrug efflux system)
MWVYFNVPESPYMDYIAGGRENQAQQIDLVLANGKRFPHSGVIGAIEAKFNNETGNIPFRADFPNPERSLRHGQTGNVLINRTIKGALVIPQRATFEILDKRYVFLVGADGLVNQQEVTIVHEQDDIFLIGKGLTVTDRVVLEGVRQVKDGEKIEFEYRKPEDALAHQKNHAE